MEMTRQPRSCRPMSRRCGQALNDPEVLQALHSGLRIDRPRSATTEYRIALTARVGPVAAKFAGRLQLADVDPPHGYTLSFDGQGGAAGFAKGEAQVALTPAGRCRHALDYTVKAQVGGKIAQIGSRLVDGAARKLADDFFARFVDASAAGRRRRRRRLGPRPPARGGAAHAALVRVLSRWR